MPTYTDQDAVVHEAEVSDGMIRLRCERRNGVGGPPRSGKITTHETAAVTCFGCLAEGPRPFRVHECMTCDRCGAWWTEMNERLVAISAAFLETLDSYRVLAQGTLPLCPRCRPL